MLSDSGSGAMSDSQWAGMMTGDESYAGSKGYYRLRDAVADIFGYHMVQPVHQGRAAEKVLYPLLLKEGQYSVSNMHFDTTRGHVTLCGATPKDLVVPDARDTDNYSPFKGNMDIARAAGVDSSREARTSRRHHYDDHEQYRRRAARVDGQHSGDGRSGENPRHSVCHRRRSLRGKRLLHQDARAGLPTQIDH